MLGWCLYELIYLLAFFGLFLGFGVCIVYSYLRVRITQATKFFALHAISTILLGVGYVSSEFYIDFFGNYSCDSETDIAIKSMIISFACVVYLCVKFRAKEYVLNSSVNHWLAVVSVLLYFGGITIFAIEILS
jgi:hypothetical protein